jgi:TPR repeat protein
VCSSDLEESIERLREWLDKGEAWAQSMMGQWYRDGKYGLKQSYVMAAMLYEKAVVQGDPDAMCNLAHLYEDGQGVVQSFKKAAELYTMAAEQGTVNARSMFNLGNLYRDGKGVAQSSKKAVKYFSLAADQGHVKAMNSLGALYFQGQDIAQSLCRDGKGVDQSFKKAIENFTMAAEQGHANAMVNLGVMYIQGQGVAQSNELARAWWTKAANKGQQAAIEYLKTLDKQVGKSTTTASTTTESPPPPVCCSACNTPQPSGQTFQKCMGCRTVQYCNKDCQRAHWRQGGHKQVCKRLRKKKETTMKKSSSIQNTKKSK